MRATFGTWLLATVAAFALAACGGGGGGGGGGTDAGGESPTSTGLVPAAPALGATLHADATLLRPMRDGATWAYTGTAVAYNGAAPVAYRTTTVQSGASASGVTEAGSNPGNLGSDTQAVTVAAGVISIPFSYDFAGKGTPENFAVVELRSPVRQGDQMLFLDKRYTDTNIDQDGDRRFDALDVAYYGRVVGNEVVTLPNLPSVTAVRVDFVLLTRVRLSSSGQFSPTVTARLQAWYAPGIGMVRQRSEVPAAGGVGLAIDDEVLQYYDGVGTGFGALPQRAPSSAELGGQVPSGAPNEAWVFPGHALLLSGVAADPNATLAIRYGLRGEVLGSQVVRGIAVYDRSRMAQLNDGVVLVDELPSGTSNIKRMTVFNSDGSLRGAVGAATLDLGGTRLAPSVGTFNLAGDGDRFWLVWTRIYRDTDATLTIRQEMVLRPFSPQGVPLADERVMPMAEMRTPDISARNGQVVMTWTSPTAPHDLNLAYLDTATGALRQRVVYAGLPGTSSFVRPLALDSGGGVLLWASQLGSGGQQPQTAGLRLDAGLNPVRSGTVPLDELLPGVPTLSFQAARPSARGARLVFTTRDGGEQFQPPQFGDLTRVTWIDVPTSGPLKAAPPLAVAFDLRQATAQAVFADRVLVFSGSSVNVVWLNAGR